MLPRESEEAKFGVDVLIVFDLALPRTGFEEIVSRSRETAGGEDREKRILGASSGFRCVRTSVADI